MKGLNLSNAMFHIGITCKKKIEDYDSLSRQTHLGISYYESPDGKQHGGEWDFRLLMPKAQTH